MRYLHVPKRFNIPTPILPFRRRNPSKEDPPDQIPPNQHMQGPRRLGPRTRPARGFAVKFYDILCQESSDIITWTESGQAFQVLDYTRFSEEILLKYFRHNKFSSFRRQLNLYGYRKVIKGPDAGAYMHPSFQRGRPELLGEVKKGKVPHYDIHGINEIHGQHFRHHPPGAKDKKGLFQEQSGPADLTPAHNPASSPVTPEIHGVEHPARPATFIAMPDSAALRLTPGTQAARELSKMSLEPMEPLDGWHQEPAHNAEALTITPAWGGAVDDSSAGVSSTGGAVEKVEGGRGSGSGRSTSDSRDSQSSAPVAYWNKTRKRRTLSSQLIFPSQAPKDTEEIVQPDPSLFDVMNVICQCMEIRSSTEGSNESDLSQLSACSFKRESSRRTSIPDLLACLSYESALRGSVQARGSLAGAMDAVMSGPESVEAMLARTAGGNGNSNSSHSNADSNGSDDAALPPRPALQQLPSFDPTGDPGGGIPASIPDILPPAVVSSSPVPMAQRHQQPLKQTEPAGRPSFDPNRESTIAAGIQASGYAQRRNAENSLGQELGPLFVSGTGGSEPLSLSRESSRESTTARIFKSAATRAPTASRGSWEVGGVGHGPREWGNGRDSGGSSGTARSSGNWSLLQASQVPSATAGTTTSGWGSPQLSRNSGGSAAEELLSTTTTSGIAPEGMDEELEMLRRQSSRGRFSCLSWLAVPSADKRATIHENGHVDRMLADESNFAAVTRVSEDADSMLLAKTIGDFLG